MRLLSLLFRKPPNRAVPGRHGEVDTVPVTDSSVPIQSAHIAQLDSAPAWLTPSERLLLFTLIVTTRPSRYLEIGSFKGGSALIVQAAMDASRSDGKIICVDPEPRISEDHWSRLRERSSLVKGFSPDVLNEAHATAGGSFDFVFIDGDHTVTGVVRDAKGVVPYLAERANLLFHDAFNPEVDAGIQVFLRKYPNAVDCGVLTREISYLHDGGEDIPFGGLRLVQWR